jgi:hypothetical protein
VRTLAAAAVALLLGGCAGQGFIPPGGVGYQWTTLGSKKNVPSLGVEHMATIVSQRCPDGDKTCIAVIVAREPPGFDDEDAGAKPVPVGA